MKFWNTKPNVPSKLISPLSSVSKSVMHLSNVDLPDPDGPIMDNTSPFSTLKEISFNTTLSPKLFFRFLTSNKLMISPLSVVIIQSFLETFHYKCYKCIEQIIESTCNQQCGNGRFSCCNLFCNSEHFRNSKHE